MNEKVKTITITLCETQTGNILGSARKRIIVNTPSTHHALFNSWIESFSRGLTSGKNITLQLSVDETFNEEKLVFVDVHK